MSPGATARSNLHSPHPARVLPAYVLGAKSSHLALCASQLDWLIIFVKLAGLGDPRELVKHTVGCVWAGVSSPLTYVGLENTRRNTKFFNPTMISLLRRECRNSRWTPSLYIRSLSSRDCPQQVRIWSVAVFMSLHSRGSQMDEERPWWMKWAHYSNRNSSSMCERGNFLPNCKGCLWENRRKWLGVEGCSRVKVPSS